MISIPGKQVWKQSVSRPLFGTFSYPGLLSLLIFAALAVAGTFSSSARAQTQSGLSTIQGTVTDSTGAVIRDATIHIVNSATGAATDAKSNAVGFFQAPGLVAGAYTVRVEASNMKTYLYKLSLLATQTAVVNPVMAAGSVTQQVTVSASMVQLHGYFRRLNHVHAGE